MPHIADVLHPLRVVAVADHELALESVETLRA
jgi:hypothetical protein